MRRERVAAGGGAERVNHSSALTARRRNFRRTILPVDIRHLTPIRWLKKSRIGFWTTESKRGSAGASREGKGHERTATEMLPAAKKMKPADS